MEEDIFIVESFLKNKKMLLKHPVWVSEQTLQAIENLINKCKEQQQVIELMIEYIKKTDFITEDYCFRREDCENVGGNRLCKDCILDYFKKKVRE